MNVIGSRPDGWWRDRPAAIERLVAEVDRWAAGVEEAVTVVLEREPARPLRPEHVEVIWAPPPAPESAKSPLEEDFSRTRDAADKEILRRLAQWLAADEVTVVTSDRTLAGRAREQGARVEGASTFRRRLD
jgi:YacP-like NYN domain